jgi:hypothetical protein
VRAPSSRPVAGCSPASASIPIPAAPSFSRNSGAISAFFPSVQMATSGVYSFSSRAWFAAKTPSPATMTGFPLKKKPSQLTQYDTPSYICGRFLQFSDERALHDAGLALLIEQ